MKIDGQSYNDDLRWLNEFSTASRAGSSRQTMGAGGRTVRQATLTEIKKNIVIGSETDGERIIGYWTYGQIKQLEEYEKGATVLELEYEGRIFTVWVAAGGIDVEPRLGRPNMADDDIMVGSVTFEQL